MSYSLFANLTTIVALAAIYAFPSGAWWILGIDAALFVGVMLGKHKVVS